VLQDALLVTHFLHENTRVEQALQYVKIPYRLVKCFFQGLDGLQVAFVLEEQAFLPDDVLVARLDPSRVESSQEIDSSLWPHRQGTFLQENINQVGVMLFVLQILLEAPP